MARARRVYKAGGPALEDPGLLAPLAREIAAFDGEVALVHGGGRQVERMLEKLGIESRFVDGRRQTSPAAMEVVEMILSGSTNKALASSLTQAGVPAVGISGRDGGLIRASLWAAKLLPVISPVSSGPSGETVNVNADEAAQWIARRIGAETLVFLSDVDGVNLDGGPVSELNEAAIEARTKDGSIHGGMAMKVRMALDAARSGIPSVIIAGRARLSDGFPGTSISIK